MDKRAINNRVLEALNAILHQKKEHSKASLAASLGVSPTKFSEILNGRMMAGTDLMATLCVKYEVNASWLLTGIDNLAPSPTPPQFEALIDRITQLSEENGRLKARIDELERRRGDNAEDVNIEIARAG